jgi:hypothetical protein
MSINQIIGKTDSEIPSWSDLTVNSLTVKEHVSWSSYTSTGLANVATLTNQQNRYTVANNICFLKYDSEISPSADDTDIDISLPVTPDIGGSFEGSTVHIAYDQAGTPTNAQFVPQITGNLLRLSNNDMKTTKTYRVSTILFYEVA